jgi:oxygen-independent coproporphyrinogen III oxidase
MAVSSSHRKVAYDFARRLEQHEAPTYVYTYPFKGAYRLVQGNDLVAKAWEATSGPLNVYIHIPYCEMKCSFCHLFTTTQHGDGTFARYVSALKQETQLVANQLDLKHFEVDSLYFGGGTPMLLSSKLLAQVVEQLDRLFKFRPSAELAIEAAPNSTDFQKVRDLRRLGFQRLSLGVQSFLNEELKRMGRAYDSRLGVLLARAAMTIGFRNVNVDLIYGLPDQSLKSWLSNLSVAVDLGVHTVTIYPLTLREKTAFGKQYKKNQRPFIRAGNLYRLYDAAVEFLSSRGYRQLTMAAFATEGGGSRHEFNEFTGVPTLGFGVSALSYAPSFHYTSGNYVEAVPNAQVIEDYFQAIDAGSIPVRTGIWLDRDELRRRYLILRLLYTGANRADYHSQFGEVLGEYFGLELGILREENCIQETMTHIELSPRGRRFSNLVVDLLASERVKDLSTVYR